MYLTILRTRLQSTICIANQHLPELLPGDKPIESKYGQD